MDIFSATIEASSILLTVYKLIKKAIEQQKEKPALLETYGAEVNETKNVVDLVRDQDPLQTAGAVVTVRRVQSIGNDLKVLLMRIGLDRSAFKEFAHQLRQGTADQRELANIMEHLTRAKQNLIIQIQVASVGLMKNVNEAIAINTSLVAEMNEIVQKAVEIGGLVKPGGWAFGQDHGLIIARFLAKLEDRPSEPDGSVQLTDTEYADLNSKGIQITHPEMADASSDDKRRIICNNLCKDQALQILGPVQVDMWRDMAFLKIEGNMATGNSIQVGYPITMEVFDKLMSQRGS